MHILIATDGSPEADLAVRLGGEIEQMVSGPVTLLSVIRHSAERPQAEAILLRAKTLLPHADRVETQLCIGQVADEIINAAQNEQQIIVMGEKPPHGLVGRLLPPTTEKVINQMSCPVLLARGAVRPFRKVLVCESGRVPSLLNRLITQLAPLLRLVDELTALHVMSQIAAAPGVRGWELRASADETPKSTTIKRSASTTTASLLTSHPHCRASSTSRRPSACPTSVAAAIPIQKAYWPMPVCDA